MWIATGISIVLTVAAMLLIFAIAQKRRCKKINEGIKTKEEVALKGISAGIKQRLHAAYPELETQWRWVCRPAGFALNGALLGLRLLTSSRTLALWTFVYQQAVIWHCMCLVWLS